MHVQIHSSPDLHPQLPQRLERLQLALLLSHDAGGVCKARSHMIDYERIWLTPASDNARKLGKSGAARKWCHGEAALDERWRDVVADEFRDLAARLPAMAAAAPITLCGMSACVDARVNMARNGALFSARHPGEAAAFADLLLERASRGVGGEVRVAWADGPRWLTDRLDITYALGGVGPQAGWVLSTLGAPALVCLEDRSAHMLAQLPARLLVAADGRAVPAGELTASREPRPDIFIFEYTAGVPIGEVIPRRSSRIIVRFNDPGLEHDQEFEQLACRLAGEAGAGLVAGFNCVPPEELEAEIERVFGLARRWREAGLATIHLEMSGFADCSARSRAGGRARCRDLRRHEPVGIPRARPCAGRGRHGRACLGHDDARRAIGPGSLVRSCGPVGGGGDARRSAPRISGVDGRLPCRERAGGRRPTSRPPRPARRRGARAASVRSLRPAGRVDDRRLPDTLSAAAGHHAWPWRHLYRRLSARPGQHGPRREQQSANTPAMGAKITAGLRSADPPPAGGQKRR